VGVYDAEAAAALAAIAEKGEVCTLRRFTAGAAPDGDKPWRTADATALAQTANAVFLNYNLQTSGETYVNGTLVQRGDKKVLVAASGLDWDPELDGELVRADGSVWKIQNVKTLDPNGEKILHTLQVRQ
jgi:hypothetical protein